MSMFLSLTLRVEGAPDYKTLNKAGGPITINSDAIETITPGEVGAGFLLRCGALRHVMESYEEILEMLNGGKG